MPRLLRFIPEGGALVEVTTRTLQGRLLLTPKPQLNPIIAGALARASRRHGVGVEADAAAALERTGRKPLGAEAILRQDPTTRPEHLKKSPAPRFHAFTKKIRQDLYQAYSWFVAVFREAAEKLRQGDRTAQFPVGCFPPHLPFVREAPPPGLPQRA